MGVSNLPIFTIIGKDIILKSQYAFFSCESVLLLKAISVFSNEVIAQN
jgi:hypothetical protein